MISQGHSCTKFEHFDICFWYQFLLRTIKQTTSNFLPTPTVRVDGSN